MSIPTHHEGSDPALQDQPHPGQGLVGCLFASAMLLGILAGALTFACMAAVGALP